MKKSLFLIGLLTLLALSTFAQTDRGTVLLGISGNGSITKSYLGKAKHFNIAPQAGYFIAKNLVVGAQLTYDYTTINPLFSKYSTATTAGAFARYYVGAGKFKPYLSAQLGYSWSHNQGDILGAPFDSRKNEKLEPAAGIGVSYFVVPKVAIEAQADYHDDSALSFRLGLSLYLPR